MQRAAFRKADFPSSKLKAAEASKMVIAIDGPAASGKGTLARKIAARFGFAHLDTGALYRAVANAMLKQNADPANADDALRVTQELVRTLNPEFLMSAELRLESVSRAASLVAAHAGVRAALLDYQRDFAANPPVGVDGVVLDGRDIGTVVWPQADIKLYITASAEVRARRRCSEVAAKGQDADFEAILTDIRERDHRDMTRPVAPLVPAKDAFVLDTSTLGVTDVLHEALALIRAQMQALTGDTPVND